MKAIRYVTMNPTGNLTCLVLDDMPESERPAVTAALMNRCEQVGYLSAAVHNESRACLRMMGGEFCGNAAMAAAAWLCREDGLRSGGEMSVQLDVSGAAGPVPCRIRSLENDIWEGTVRMPDILSVSETELEGMRMAMVQMEGITHLILEDTLLQKSQAESLLLRIAEKITAPAVGLLQWDASRKWMVPLVFVRESRTLEWETGCGSGSTAVAAWLFSGRENGKTETCVNQPGGCIRVRAEILAGRAESMEISGKITLREEGLLG